MFKKRLAEIRARKAELRKQLESAQDVNLDEIEAELRNLDKEQGDIERRQAICDGLASGTLEGNEVPNPTNEQRNNEPRFTRETVLSTPEYRSAWAKTLMRRALTPIEERALETALTTTDTTYAAPSANADGINNGGLFIPTEINTALVEAISLVSPIFRDAARTAVPGLLKFPYKETASGAKNKKETEKSPDGSIKWAELTLGLSEIAETIRVSWRLEAMAVEQFISYITAELIEQVQDKAVTDLIYGTGTEQMKGATLNAVSHTYTGSVLDAIGGAIGKAGKKQKIGAKLYVAQSIVEEIAFSKDDNGQYIFTPINNVGVNSIATYKVEVDPYLNDGDFIFGNLGRYLRLNIVEDVSVTKDSSGKSRTNDYTAFALIGAAAQPNTLVYGRKTS